MFGVQFKILKNFFRIALNEDDIQLFLQQYNSDFIRIEKLTGISSNKNNSEVIYTMGDLEGTLQIDYDDISMKVKPILKRFRGSFRTVSFNEKSIFNTSLGVTSL